MSKVTDLIHHPYEPPEGWAATLPGLHKASTVFFSNVAALRERQWIDRSAYTYGLKGTPTVYHLEARLATLEGAEHIILVPSGLAAIALVDLALLKAGDEVLLPDNAYTPNLNLARHELAGWGVGHQVYDPMDGGSLSARLNERTRLVWLEAPGSVTLEFPDVPDLVRRIREQAPRAVIALDHTWGAGLAYAPFDWGVDLTVHALTKYPSGGGDVLMGSVGVRDEALYRQLAWAHSRLGYGVAADDVAAVLRGLPSMHLRYAAQDASARQIAVWAQQQAPVARVLHPALPGSPGHEHWARHCAQAASLLTLEFDPRLAQPAVDAFVDALRLFRIGWSWAGPVSLAAPYDLRTLRSRVAEGQGLLVRLCIGLEDTADLIGDLEQAMSPLAQALAGAA